MSNPTKAEAQDALKLLDTVTAQVALNRPDHQRVLTAVQVLNAFILAASPQAAPLPEVVGQSHV